MNVNQFLQQLQFISALQAMEERKKLPIFQKMDDILGFISSSPVVLIRGETGSGKTTQVPQYILDDFIRKGNGAHCNIIVTQACIYIIAINILYIYIHNILACIYILHVSLIQPRRISAVSISERVSDERCENMGQSVGYSVRFESVLPRAHGSILYCTVGMFSGLTAPFQETLICNLLSW